MELGIKSKGGPALNPTSMQYRVSHDTSLFLTDPEFVPLNYKFIKAQTISIYIHPWNYGT